MKYGGEEKQSWALNNQSYKETNILGISSNEQRLVGHPMDLCDNSKENLIDVIWGLVYTQGNCQELN